MNDATLKNWVKETPWPAKVLAPMQWWWLFRRPGSKWRGLDAHLYFVTKTGAR